ncbi:hypothetical protein [Providencia sp. Me31A]|uniref:hypothetical protein n=1 Tax=Providencia sp. Me31A TaxID=3392637 RepID=UPI003D2B7E8B
MMNYIKSYLLFIFIFSGQQSIAAVPDFESKEKFNSYLLTGSLWLNITVVASPCYINYITPTRTENYYYLDLDGCGNPLASEKEKLPLQLTITNLNTKTLQSKTNRIYDGQNKIIFKLEGSDNVEVRINYQ